MNIGLDASKGMIQSCLVCSCQRQYITSAHARVTMPVFVRFLFNVRDLSQSPSWSVWDIERLAEDEASDSELKVLVCAM